MRGALIRLALSLAVTAPLAAPALAALDYPWLAGMGLAAAELPSLATRFTPPAGFKRVEVAPGSFAAWLRSLPLYPPDRAAVLDFRGRPLVRPWAAIVALDVGGRDLQQCADSVLRLHAEWLWAAGRADEAAYHFTSGDRSAWRDWRGGERFVVSGAKVRRVRGGKTLSGHRAYRAWLAHLFGYASTRSLPRDLRPVPASQPIEAGDVFDAPGSPGHAVLILDVATDTAGERVGLVGQGFIPAEDLHVVRAPGARRAGEVDRPDRVWFRLPADPTGRLETPSWVPFRRAEALRFRAR